MRRNRLPPGAIRADRSGVRIGTASQPVLLGTVQPPGKKQMDAADWARGARLDDTATALMTRPAATARRKPLDPARRAAFDVLRAVSERDAYANLALPALLRERGITGRDAAFATELAYGTCRTRGLLDAVIADAAGRPPDQISPVLLDLLRLGTYQLLRTRVDAHAAVSTTVEQAGIEFDTARAGFVNGVLRTIAGRDEQSWIDELAPSADTDPVGHMAFVHAHPRWIAQAFADALGADAGELDACWPADDDRPLVHLAARPGRADRRGARRGRSTAPSAATRRTRCTWPAATPVSSTPVRDGAGAGAGRGQPARGPRADARTGRRRRRPVAGPVRRARRQDGAAGGDRRAGSGARVTAMEPTPRRAELVEQNTARTAVEVLRVDGREPGSSRGFDRVLVDAPCTGLGALRRTARGAVAPSARRRACAGQAAARAARRRRSG